MDMFEFPNWEVNRYYAPKKKQFNHVLNMYVDFTCVDLMRYQDTGCTACSE